MCIWESNCLVIDNNSELEVEFTVPLVETSPYYYFVAVFGLEIIELITCLGLLKLNCASSSGDILVLESGSSILLSKSIDIDDKLPFGIKCTIEV